MGIDTEAKLLLGLPYSEVPQELWDEVDALLDNGEIDYASPYYDSCKDEWIIGISIPCWGETIPGVYTLADSAKWDIPKVLKGLELLLYVSPHVT